MLVLSRATNEKIRIGKDVVVTIVRVKGRRVRVGIEAPRGVKVLRDEIPDDGGEDTLGVPGFDNPK
jgi:carbon storage regulator